MGICVCFACIFGDVGGCQIVLTSMMPPGQEALTQAVAAATAKLESQLGTMNLQLTASVAEQVKLNAEQAKLTANWDLEHRSVRSPPRTPYFL
jgi:hypothetical protein